MTKAKYRHTLVYRIDGVHLGEREGEVEVIADPAVGFHAVISSDPDDYCFEGDRWTALAALRLNAIFRGLEATQERLADELEEIRVDRRRRFGAGPYLVLVRDDEVEEFSPHLEGETEHFVVCRGGPPRELLRQSSRPHVLAALAAMAVATGDVSGIEQVSDTVVFFRGDGKPIYCYTRSATANPSVLRMISEDSIGSVEGWYRAIARDQELERVVRLLVSSLQTEGDALRSFLYAWTAIEIFVNKTFRSHEEQFFRTLGDGEHPDARRQYLERSRTGRSGKYSLTDKFALIASFLCPESADEDVGLFKRVKQDRDKLVHGQDVHEAGLPVRAVQELLRRYLRLYLAV